MKKNLYFKRHWDETTGDPSTDSWGTSTYYFETDISGQVLRQIEVYANGRKLKYDSTHIEDKYGGLSEVPLDFQEFEGFIIEQKEFEELWK